MNNSTIIKILVAVALVAVVAILWHKGYFLRIANYVQETRDELKKCSWPSLEELKGSTVVVMVSILLLGVFTVAVDQVLLTLVHDGLLKLFTST